jgi:hypothetical protein
MRISAKLGLRLKEKVLVCEHTKHFKGALAFAREKMLTNASRLRDSQSSFCVEASPQIRSIFSGFTYSLQQGVASEGEFRKEAQALMHGISNEVLGPVQYAEWRYTLRPALHQVGFVHLRRLRTLI